MNPTNIRQALRQPYRVACSAGSDIDGFLPKRLVGVGRGNLALQAIPKGWSVAGNKPSRNEYMPPCWLTSYEAADVTGLPNLLGGYAENNLEARRSLNGQVATKQSGSSR